MTIGLAGCFKTLEIMGNPNFKIPQMRRIRLLGKVVTVDCRMSALEGPALLATGESPWKGVAVASKARNGRHIRRANKVVTVVWVSNVKTLENNENADD